MPSFWRRVLFGKPLATHQSHHQRLTGLIDGEQRAIGDDQRQDDDGGHNAANEIESHRAAPVCGGAGGCGRRESWSSGR